MTYACDDVAPPAPREMQSNTERDRLRDGCPVECEAVVSVIRRLDEEEWP